MTEKKHQVTVSAPTRGGTITMEEATGKQPEAKKASATPLGSKGKSDTKPNK